MPQSPSVADLSRSLRAAYQQSQEALDAELAAIEANPARYARVSRLRELQRSVQGMTDQLDEQARDWLSTQFPHAYAIGAQSVGEFAWTQADRFAITQLAQDSFEDLLSATQHVDDTTKALVRALGKNAALLKETTGRTATDAGKRLAKLLESKGVGTVTYANGAKHGIGEYSDMLLRTVSAQAHNLGTLNFGARTGTKYYEVGDGSDCGTVSHEDTDKANRQIWPIDKCREFSLAHPRCVAEGTAVEPLGAVTAGYMARWDGPAIVIRTAGGSRLTVTPNHPVLTGRGWVAAKFLNEGDQVVRRTRQVGRSHNGALLAHGDFDQVPALIEDVFDALRAGGSDASAVPAPEDFHGDAERMVGEVRVVDADGYLLADHNTPVPEQFLEPSLIGADVVHPLGVGPGPLLLSPLRLRTARTRGVPTRFHVPRVGSSGPERDAPLFEPMSDDQIADSDFLGELRRRFAVEVSLDTVVQVRDDDPTSGHFYDLSTEEGAYFAESILVHNCRRSFFGRPDLRTPQDAREATSLISDEQQADQTAAEKARAAGFKAKAETKQRRAQSRRKVEARKAQSQARVDARAQRSGVQGDLELDRIGTLPKPSSLPHDADGLTPAQLKAARRDLPKLKANVRETAARVQGDARTALESIDIAEMAPPIRTGPGSELYEWYYRLNPQEQQRLRNTWMKAERQVANPDLIADRISEAYGPEDFDAQMMRWVEETRRADAGGLLARGKQPIPGRYGDLDVDGIFGDGTFHVSDLFDSDPDYAVRSVATTTRSQAQEFAARAFVKTKDGRLAPYEMDEDAYVREFTAMEERMANAKPIRSDPEFGDEFSAEDNAVLTRMYELLPEGVDDAGELSADQIYRRIVELAVEAGLR